MGNKSYFRRSDKIELYVWEGPHTEDMIKITRQLLKLSNDDNFIRQNMKRHGVADENIPHAIPVTKNKAIADKAFYDLIKDAVNNSVQVDTDKIEDVWKDTFPKNYRFIMERTKTGK